MKWKSDLSVCTNLEVFGHGEQVECIFSANITYNGMRFHHSTWKLFTKSWLFCAISHRGTHKDDLK